MILTDHLDRPVTPDELNEKLRKIRGFVSGGGDLIYVKITELFETCKFIKRVPCLKIPADTAEIAAWLKAGHYCVAEIDMDLRDPDVDEHWVLLTGGSAAKFTLHDPWQLPKDQEVFTMPPVYCKQGWTPARAIYSYVMYENQKPRG
jgi:hypothetical protein